ncbi:MAG: phosphatase PAP2 family protein [Acidimicrobiales bacterium]
MQIPDAVAVFDTRVDELIEAHLRGRPLVDRIMYGASAIGDHGTLWMALAGLQALRRARGPIPQWRRPLMRAIAGLAIESALVNGPVKWMFRRSRPVGHGRHPHPHSIRLPRTSSFPSGHATAAFFAAALLRDGDNWWPLYYVAAVVVASSRAHVKVHHASDVVAGAILGAGLGQLTRALVPVEH